MKGPGYLVSTVSVFLLGAAAWPKPEEPGWKALAVLAGMVTAIGGMFLRYLSHRKEKHKMAAIQNHARQA